MELRKPLLYMHAAVLLLLSIGGLQSCGTAELHEYEAGPGAYFNTLFGDSLNYSFANQIEDLERDTVLIDMRVMGDLPDQQRVIQLEAMEGTTAVEGKDYVLPAFTIAAKQHDIKYPVILINTQELKINTLKLMLRVAKNKDFPEGTGIIKSGFKYDKFRLNFNNRLIKPSYWLYIQNYFGDYSDVKYRFMIDVLGIADFTPDQLGGLINYSDFINYGGTMRKELEAYEAKNGPMLDETGKEISFPI